MNKQKTKKILFFITLFVFLLMPRTLCGQEFENTKHYISIGFLDHKTGNSFLGYTRSIVQNKNNELFVGGGTLIASNTLLIGFKKYLFRSFVDGYSTVSMQKIYGMGGQVKSLGLSMGVEKKIWKLLFLNLGFHTLVELNSITNSELLAFPNLNLNIRF